MTSWIELTSVCDADLSVSALTAATFDTEQELLWIGNEHGRVTSYVGCDIEKYTSFRAHQGPVRQLMSLATGILSVGPQSLQFRDRRGLVRWTIR
jgi:PAB-dependent poly(A)-specific ribonuclease subunit 2